MVRSLNYTSLHEAVDNENLSQIKNLLEMDAPIEAQEPKWGNTPLYRTVLTNFVPAAKLLLTRGANPNSANKDGVTAVYQAAAMGHDIVVELLLKAKAHPDRRSSLGQTALHSACINSRQTVIEPLIHAGADVNAETGTGACPLYIAAERGDVIIASKLLSAGAYVDGPAAERGEASFTPLIRAAQKGHKEIVQLLILSHANTTLKDPSGRNASNYATDSRYHEITAIIEASHPNILRARGLELYIAVERNSLQHVKDLVAHGAPLEDRDLARGCTALHRAVTLGYTAVARYLITAKADVNCSDREGYSVLYQACTGGHLPIVELLLEAKANTERHMATGQTALYGASSAGQIGAVELLLRHGANCNARSSSGATALYIATERGSLRTMRTLIEGKADVNLVINRDRVTALARGAFKGDLEAVKLLVTSGADPRLKCADKLPEQWALHGGDSRGHLAVFQYLQAQREVVQQPVVQLTSRRQPLQLQTRQPLQQTRQSMQQLQPTKQPEEFWIARCDQPTIAAKLRDEEISQRGRRLSEPRNNDDPHSPNGDCRKRQKVTAFHPEHYSEQ